MDDLLFLTTEDLIEELLRLADLANQELAHEKGDEIMVILLLRAVQGEVSPTEAGEAVEAYQSLGRSFG